MRVLKFALFLNLKRGHEGCTSEVDEGDLEDCAVSVRKSSIGIGAVRSGAGRSQQTLYFPKLLHRQIFLPSRKFRESVGDGTLY